MSCRPSLVAAAEHEQPHAMPRRVADLSIEVPPPEGVAHAADESGSGGAVRPNSKAKRAGRRFSPYGGNVAAPQLTLGLSGPLNAMNIVSVQPVSARTRAKQRFQFHRSESKEVASLLAQVFAAAV